MTTHRSTLPVILLTSMLAASGCGAFAGGADPSRSAPEAAWGYHADARPAPGRARLQAGTAAVPGTGVRHAPAGGTAVVTAVVTAAETADSIAPGAVLDVWLNDPAVDLRTLSSGTSLGNAVVRGDFFRYASVNSDPGLRGYWGRPLLLKWSALLRITEHGKHVFVTELSKERRNGAIAVRTLVRLNGETLFEEEVRKFGVNEISETGSRELVLAPGRYELEVLLAVRNVLALPPSTQLGTYLRMRAPSDRTPVPVQSRLWYRTGTR